MKEEFGVLLIQSESCTLHRNRLCTETMFDCLEAIALTDS